MRYELQYDGRGEGYFLSREAAHGHARELAAVGGRRLERFRVVPVTHGRLNLARAGVATRAARYGVYRHADWVEGRGAVPTGRGYVAREVTAAVPYSRMEPLRVFRRRADADKMADRLTFEPSGAGGGRDRAGPLGEPEVDPRIYGDPAVPFAAQHWYSGQGDPLYALASSGWPQPLSTAEWALANAMRARRDFDAAMRQKYGKKRRRWSSEDHNADNQLRELEEGLTESVRRRSAQEWY